MKTHLLRGLFLASMFTALAILWASMPSCQLGAVPACLTGGETRKDCGITVFNTYCHVVCDPGYYACCDGSGCHCKPSSNGTQMETEGGSNN